MLDENILIERVKSGDESAMEEIFKMFKKKLYYLAYDLTGNREDAEDLSQEVFLKAYKSIKDFRGESRLTTWLYRIAVNKYLDIRRKKAARLISESGELDERLCSSFSIAMNSRGSNPDRLLDEKTISEKVNQALQKISPNERTAFILRHYHDFQIAEVAKIMNSAVGTIKSLHFRAIKKLRKELAIYITNPDMKG